jgi:hypothetical protein
MDKTSPGACPLAGWVGGVFLLLLAMVDLPTAVLYNEFHNICYFLLKKEILLFQHHWYTAQWISVGC